MPIKTIIYIIAFSTLISCKAKHVEPDAVPIVNQELNNKFSKSAYAWDRLSTKHGNSYEYVIEEKSNSGYENKLIVTVTIGRVSKREFWETKKNDDGTYGPMEIVYRENPRTVGHFKQGLRPTTYERFYINCATKSLVVDETKNNILFETNEDDIITACGYTPHNCEDDCFKGIMISELRWGE